MSAIVGFYRLRGRRAEPAILERMVDQLAHRGPDGTGVWHQGPVALGHLRLRTASEPEVMPLVRGQGDLVLTADARLDNREELIDILGLTHSDPGAISDDALILAAYERWGEACVERLLGDFAFALWDGRRQRLFCARDHFGVRPLYYYLSDTLFAFATEIKGLFCIPEVPRRVNERWMAAFLAACDPPEPYSTLFDGVRRFPPRHRGSMSEGGFRLEQYWAPDPTREIRLGSDAEYEEAFQHHFTEAVRCRMRTHGRVGAMLSGGIDSSSIACMARHLLRQTGGGPLATFSAVFDEVEKSDERPYLEAVLAGGDIEPFVLSADSVSPLTDVERILWHHDEANASGNLYINWSLAGAARDRGVRVLLDGYDGDTTLSHGHGYLVELARGHRWATLAMEMREYGRKAEVEEPWLRAWLRWLHQYEIDPVVARSAPLRLSWRAWRALRFRLRSRTRHSSTAKVTTLIQPEFARRTGVHDRAPAGYPGDPGAATERVFHHRRVVWDLHAEILETLDKVAGAFDLEMRFPFWDRRLVEFCLALPADQKRRRGWGRWIIRPALEGILPPAVQWRGTKSNLSYGLDHGLLKWERQQLDRFVQVAPEILGGYVDLAMLRQTFDRFVTGSATEEESLALWRALSLAVWLEGNASRQMPSAGERPAADLSHVG